MAEDSPGDGRFDSFLSNLSSVGTMLSASLSRVRAIVGLAAGLVSIFGALYSMTGFFKPTPIMGEVVAVVQEARSDKAVSDATIEILTPQNALVTTLRPNSIGRARYTLPEGAYRLRVSHPRFRQEVRQIQVLSGQTAEVQVRVRRLPAPSPPSPLARAERAVNEGVRAVRRLFGQ